MNTHFILFVIALAVIFVAFVFVGHYKIFKKIDFSLIAAVIFGALFGTITAINYHPNGAEYLEQVIVK